MNLNDDHPNTFPASFNPQDTDMNLKQWTAGGLIAATSALTGVACKPITDIVTDRNSAGQEIKIGNEFNITKNPNPKKGYKLHVKIKDAPGPFGYSGGGASFEIENINDCGYFLGGSFQGTVPGVDRTIGIPITKISENEYEGTFYTDWAVDGDFFGKGMCRWRFSSAGMVFHAGLEEDTRFTLALYGETFVPNKPLVRFYRKAEYPKAVDLPNYSYRGFDAETAKQHAPEKLFSITMTLQEIK